MTDIDRAIDEFQKAVAGLFLPSSEIDRLKIRILQCQIAGLPTLFYRQELCERMAAQIMQDVA